jgi:hypothetical protein
MCDAGSADQSHKVHAHMLDVLSSVLLEMSPVPDELFDTILERLLEPKKVCVCVCVCECCVCVCVCVCV